MHRASCMRHTEPHPSSPLPSPNCGTPQSPSLLHLEASGTEGTCPPHYEARVRSRETLSSVGRALQSINQRGQQSADGHTSVTLPSDDWGSLGCQSKMLQNQPSPRQIHQGRGGPNCLGAGSTGGSASLPGGSAPAVRLPSALCEPRTHAHASCFHTSLRRVSGWPAEGLLRLGAQHI